MLAIPSSVRIYLASEHADMRKGFDGLSGLTTEVLRADPLSGHLFVFYNRTRNKMKILLWEDGGFVLVYKRLERGRFHLPRMDADRGSVEITSVELRMLLDGVDLGAKRHKRFHLRRSASA